MEIKISKNDFNSMGFYAIDGKFEKMAGEHETLVKMYLLERIIPNTDTKLIHKCILEAGETNVIPYNPEEGYAIVKLGDIETVGCTIYNAEHSKVAFGRLPLSVLLNAPITKQLLRDIVYTDISSNELPEGYDSWCIMCMMLASSNSIKTGKLFAEKICEMAEVESDIMPKHMERMKHLFRPLGNLNCSTTEGIVGVLVQKEKQLQQNDVEIGQSNIVEFANAIFENAFRLNYAIVKAYFGGNNWEAHTLARAIIVAKLGRDWLHENEFTAENILIYVVAAYMGNNDDILNECFSFIERMLCDATEVIVKKMTAMPDIGYCHSGVLGRVATFFSSREYVPSMEEVSREYADDVVSNAIIASIYGDADFNAEAQERAECLVLYIAAAIHEYDRSNGKNNNAVQILEKCRFAIERKTIAYADSILRTLYDSETYWNDCNLCDGIACKMADWKKENDENCSDD